MRIGLSRAKRKLEAEPAPSVKKKLRSEIPRRRRSQISPILYSSLNLTAPCKNSGFSAFSVESSSCSYFDSEVSCGSSRACVGSESTGRSNLRKRQINEIKGSRGLVKANKIVGGAPFRRSYHRKKEIEGKGEVEVSESSCVESNCEADAEILLGRISNSNRTSGKVSEIVKKIEEIEASEAVSKSETSCVEQISGGVLNFRAENVRLPSAFKENNVLSVTSGVDSCSVAKFTDEGTEETESRALEFEYSEISGNLFDATFTVSNSESTIEQNQKSLNFESDLACTEQFSYEDVSEYSSGLFLENSDLEFSDYTPSIFFNSGSEFSECSWEDSTPSHTFSLLHQYREEFSRSTIALDSTIASRFDNKYHNQATFLRFEDEEHEESYKALRDRERRQVFLHNYAEGYCSTTEYGDLILQQRSQMVNWIVEVFVIDLAPGKVGTVSTFYEVDAVREGRRANILYTDLFLQSTERKLQQETMFLGVSLLDRFFSKGFFRDKRNLQIVGIACLTLATRLEENQPYNSVQQKDFCVSCNVYSRWEVVAMEWLVQEVLNFQCFMPTIYNFLWFYLKASKADAEVEKRAKYLAVLVLSAHEQLCYWPSTVAAVVVILASLESHQDAFHQRVIKTHIRTEDHDLNPCIESLEWLLRYI